MYFLRWFPAILVTTLALAAGSSRLVAAEPAAFVHVATDGGAGAYEAFPDVCRLADGRLMCVFYASYDHIGEPNAQWPLGGRVSYCTSSDEGATWSQPQTLLDTPEDDRDPSITQLKDGRLFCTYFTFSKATMKSTGTWGVASEDAGRTWSKPLLIAKAPYCVSSPVRELSDGSLIVGVYYEDNKDSYGAVVKSGDGGRTWGEVVTIPNGGHQLDAETDLIELGDHTLWAALRSSREGLFWSKSTDGGATWSEAVSLGCPGHCPYLHRAPHGEILLAYRIFGPSGMQTALSTSADEAQSWSKPILIDNMVGAYPSIVTLKDGTLLVVYYEEGGGSNIRAKRFSVQGTTVEWLPPFPAKTSAGN